MRLDSVELASPVGYSLTPLVIFISLLILCGVGLVILYFWPRLRNRKKTVTMVRPKNLAEIKVIYLAKCDELLKKAEGGAAVRRLYQELSMVIRNFTREATGVDVTKYTLSEISKEEFPGLYALIAEFYRPEFAEESQGDFVAAAGRTKEIIAGWN